MIIVMMCIANLVMLTLGMILFGYLVERKARAETDRELLNLAKSHIEPGIELLVDDIYQYHINDVVNKSASHISDTFLLDDKYHRAIAASALLLHVTNRGEYEYRHQCQSGLTWWENPNTQEWESVHTG